MPQYFLNNTAQSNGDHEVHKEGCIYLQFVVSKTNLGYHDNCSSAVTAARVIHRTADGCKTCSLACHSR